MDRVTRLQECVIRAYRQQTSCTNYHSNHHQKPGTKEDGGPRTETQTGGRGGDGDGGVGEERRVVKAAEQRGKKRVRELEDKDRKSGVSAG